MQEPCGAIHWSVGEDFGIIGLQVVTVSYELYIVDFSHEQVPNGIDQNGFK